MTTLTAPAPQANVASNNGEKPINLFQLGCLFVIRASHKVRAGSATNRRTSTCRQLTRGTPIPPNSQGETERLEACPTRFGSKELIDKLEELKAEFEQAARDFLLQYPQLRAEWQSEHSDVPDAAYPAAAEPRSETRSGDIELSDTQRQRPAPRERATQPEPTRRTYRQHKRKTPIPSEKRKARPAGFEPATCGLEVRCSIQLSYERSRFAAAGAAT